MAFNDIFRNFDDFLIDRIFQPIMDRMEAFRDSLKPWTVGESCIQIAILLQLAATGWYFRTLHFGFDVILSLLEVVCLGLFLLIVQAHNRKWKPRLGHMPHWRNAYRFLRLWCFALTVQTTLSTLPGIWHHPGDLLSQYALITYTLSYFFMACTSGGNLSKQRKTAPSGLLPAPSSNNNP
jgi:hypothetical protein